MNSLNDHIPEALWMISARPSMFGVKSFRQFVTFVQGWDMGRQSMGERGFFVGFEDWLTLRFGTPASNAWSSTILRLMDNKIESVEAFLKILAEFKGSS